MIKQWFRKWLGLDLVDAMFDADELALDKLSCDVMKIKKILESAHTTGGCVTTVYED